MGTTAIPIMTVLETEGRPSKELAGFFDRYGNGPVKPPLSQQNNMPPALIPMHVNGFFDPASIPPLAGLPGGTDTEWATTVRTFFAFSFFKKIRAQGRIEVPGTAGDKLVFRWWNVNKMGGPGWDQMGQTGEVELKLDTAGDIVGDLMDLTPALLFTDDVLITAFYHGTGFGSVQLGNVFLYTFKQNKSMPAARCGFYFEDWSPYADHAAWLADVPLMNAGTLPNPMPQPDVFTQGYINKTDGGTGVGNSVTTGETFGSGKGLRYDGNKQTPSMTWAEVTGPDGYRYDPVTATWFNDGPPPLTAAISRTQFRGVWTGRSSRFAFMLSNMDYTLNLFLHNQYGRNYGVDKDQLFFSHAGFGNPDFGGNPVTPGPLASEVFDGNPYEVIQKIEQVAGGTQARMRAWAGPVSGAKKLYVDLTVAWSSYTFSSYQTPRVYVDGTGLGSTEYFGNTGDYLVTLTAEVVDGNKTGACANPFGHLPTTVETPPAPLAPPATVTDYTKTFSGLPTGSDGPHNGQTAADLGNGWTSICEDGGQCASGVFSYAPSSSFTYFFSSANQAACFGELDVSDDVGGGPGSFYHVSFTWSGTGGVLSAGGHNVTGYSGGATLSSGTYTVDNAARGTAGGTSNTGHIGVTFGIKSIGGSAPYSLGYSGGLTGNIVVTRTHVPEGY